VVVVATTRRIALGSIIAATILPLALVLMRVVGNVPVAASWWGFSLMLALLIAHTHRSNISRLLAGTESRL
jgi:glycerol-3-phosphate acyltransferase PlsY